LRRLRRDIYGAPWEPLDILGHCIAQTDRVHAVADSRQTALGKQPNKGFTRSWREKKDYVDSAVPERRFGGLGKRRTRLGFIKNDAPNGEALGLETALQVARQVACRRVKDRPSPGVQPSGD
jgi:hypothetical protein